MPARRLLALLGIGALALAACRSSDRTETSTRTTRGISDTTVTVGALGDLAVYGDAVTGARARFERANAEGGVHGRTIEFTTFVDDRHDPATNRAGVEQLVEADEVFAVVPAVSPSMAGAETLAADRVPYFGWGIDPSFCAHDNGFGLTGCLAPPARDVTSNAWPLLVARQFDDDVDGRTVAVVGDDTSAGEAGVDGLAAGATDAGFGVAYAEAVVPARGLDAGAVARDVLRSDDGEAPDAVFLSSTFGNVQSLTTALRVLGYDGVVTNAVGYDPRLVGAGPGSLVFTPLAPFESASETPALRRLQADVDAAQPGQALTESLAVGYFAADLFLDILERTGRDLTAERFLEIANDDFHWSREGAVGPLVFPAAHEEPSPCGALVVSDGARFRVAVPFTCGEVVPVD